MYSELDRWHFKHTPLSVEASTSTLIQIINVDIDLLYLILPAAIHVVDEYSLCLWWGNRNSKLQKCCRQIKRPKITSKCVSTFYWTIKSRNNNVLRMIKLQIVSSYENKMHSFQFWLISKQMRNPNTNLRYSSTGPSIIRNWSISSKNYNSKETFINRQLIFSSQFCRFSVSLRSNHPHDGKFFESINQFPHTRW